MIKHEDLGFWDKLILGWVGGGNFCGSCGGKKEKWELGWKEYCTGSCSETDWGDYLLCPQCQIKHNK